MGGLTWQGWGALPAPGGAREVKCCRKGDLCTSLNVVAPAAPALPTPGGALVAPLRGLALNVLPHPVLEIILVVSFSIVGPPAGPSVCCEIAELHLLRVLRGHHLLLSWEKGLELPQTVRGEPARLGELHLRAESPCEECVPTPEATLGKPGGGRCHLLTSPRPAPAHLELQDELSFLEGAPVDRHALVGDAFQVPRPDHIT